MSRAAIIWEALGYMFLGGIITGFFSILSFRMYLKGRKEAEKRNEGRNMKEARKA